MASPYGRYDKSTQVQQQHGDGVDELSSEQEDDELGETVGDMATDRAEAEAEIEEGGGICYGIWVPQVGKRVAGSR